MGFFKTVNSILAKKACEHDWKIIKEIKKCDDFEKSFKLIMTCKKCGKLKVIKL